MSLGKWGKKGTKFLTWQRHGLKSPNLGLDTFSDGKFNGKVYFLNKLMIDRKYDVIREVG